MAFRSTADVVGSTWWSPFYKPSVILTSPIGLSLSGNFCPDCQLSRQHRSWDGLHDGTTRTHWNSRCGGLHSSSQCSHRNWQSPLPMSLCASCLLGYSDPARLAVSGGSHGGFLTGHLVGQYPDVFKCAILRNPALTLGHMVYTTDIPDWVFVEVFGSKAIP